MSSTENPFNTNSPATLAVTNQKGGVGKNNDRDQCCWRTESARMQRAVCRSRSARQCDRGGLGFPDAYDEQPPSLFDVLADTEQRSAIIEIIREHPELDLVPSNIDHHHTEREMVHVRRPTEQLSLALAEIEEAYDYIIIDCPPSLGHLTDNALLASQNILIPALAESTSKRAVELLFDHVTSIEQDFDISIRERGVVANRVEETNEATEMLEWFARAFDDTPRFEVRKRVALQRAHSAGGSLFEYDPEVDMCDVFLDIAAALDEQFGYGQPERVISPEQEVPSNE